MEENHVLNLNLEKVKRCLTGILSPEHIQLIENEQKRNVSELVKLAESHLYFATKAQGKGNWRQKVSRAYYSCYIASRAIRLAVNSYYNKLSEDHEKIGQLPNDFPNVHIWRDLLRKFKGDRNMADYDHTAKYHDMELSPNEYLEKSKEFLLVSKSYLIAKAIL